MVGRTAVCIAVPNPQWNAAKTFVATNDALRLSLTPQKVSRLEMMYTHAAAVR